MGDFRYGLRVLRKNPGFTLVAVAALALGIGSTTAIFSVVNALLLRPLGYKDPDRLMMIWESNRRPGGTPRNVISPANFLDWRDRNQVFSGMAAFSDFPRMTLTGTGEPEELKAQIVTANYFPLLGVAPLHGRTMEPSEDVPNGPNVVVMSFDLWQRRFGGDPQLVNKTITLNSFPFTVIGIMPRGFYFHDRETQLWGPLRLSDANRRRAGRSLKAFGRLKPGVSFEQAKAHMQDLGRQLETEYTDFNKNWTINVFPLQEDVVGPVKRALWILLGAVGFVLLMACANVANLLLARAAVRQREIAIRASLGAGKWRVARQLLTESVMLALVAGAFGAVLAQWGVKALLAMAPKDLQRLGDIGVDLRVLAFALLISMITGLLFGLAPVLAAARTDLSETLKEGARSSGGAGGNRLRQLLVAAEFAMALVLLTGGGLLIRSFLRLTAVDPGFRPERLLTARVQLPGRSYREPAQRLNFFNQALTRIAAAPGVESASATSFLPFRGIVAGTAFTVAGRPTPGPGELPGAHIRTVFPGYFRTMGIPLRKGRDFDVQDNTLAAPMRFIVSEALAREYFRNEDPIGKQIAVMMDRENPPGEIIGVAGDAKDSDLDQAARPTVYYVYSKLNYYGGMVFTIRTAADPLAMTSALNAVIHSLDSQLPVAEVRSMDQLLVESVARARFNMLLLALFAALALVLAGIGIYGVMSYVVTQRTREIGLRIALGARRGDVLQLVVRQGLLVAFAGVVAGLAASFALTRLLTGLLYEVKPGDPVTFGGVAGVLIVVALAATVVPARRATRVDPMIALRYE